MHVELDTGLEVVDEVPDELGERRSEFESHPTELLNVEPTILEDDGPADLLVVGPAQGQEDLVAVAGHESLERVSADDEADGRLHGFQQLLGRRPRVRVSCQCDRRSSSILLGQLAVSVTRQPVEDVQPAETGGFLFISTSKQQTDKTDKDVTYITNTYNSEQDAAILKAHNTFLREKALPSLSGLGLDGD